MPPNYDDYIYESGFGEVMTLLSDESTISEEVPFDYENKIAMLVDNEKNVLCDGHTDESIHYATENYYERGTYASTYLNNIKFPLYMLKILKFCLLYLSTQVDSCSNKLIAQKIPMHRKWFRLKCASHMLHDALIMFQFLSFI